MNTYYMVFKVTPTKENKLYDSVEGAFAHYWVLDNNAKSACSRAHFNISRYDWEIDSIKTYPINITKNHFKDKDLGLQCYMKAQEDSVASFFMAWARNGKTTISEPVMLDSSYDFDINKWLKNTKAFGNTGRCLHYESGERCKDIIRAHSIQKQGILSTITHEGHVYRLTSDISILRENKGQPAFRKVGVNKVSTFLGFCRKHDNDLFEPIDNYPLVPTYQQAFLYGYRSLCRELFVKENILNSIDQQLKDGPHQIAIKEFLSKVRTGTSVGLENLRRHKSIYDTSLINRAYKDIKYLIFLSNQKPNLAFSGIFYPHFDFLGRQLQDLGNQDSQLDLITFCSAPMKCGWGFLFSWHDSSSCVCVEFMRSLATMIHEGKRAEVLLFRLVISNCENHAISPQWWESLSAKHKNAITEKAAEIANILAITPQSYLMDGLEEIVCWKFDSVISNME